MRGIAAVGLVLFLIAACASTGEQTESAQRFALDPSGALFSDAYRQIRDYYLDPVTVQDVAVAGIDGLDGADSTLSVEPADHTVRLLDRGQEGMHFALPDPDDAEGWAAITAAAIAAARLRDPAASDEQLYQRVFDGITAKLDRFTRYAGADAARDQKAARDGFGGVGITLDFSTPEPRIAAVLVDGPSAHAGVHVGDQLIAIDGFPTAGMDQSRIVTALRGHEGAKVGLQLRRPPRGDHIFTVSVARKLIVPASVTAQHDDSIAIFRVASFNADTAQSLSQLLSRARDEMDGKLSGIVLDLRGNPGGLLDQAVDVAALFLGHGEVVSTKGRHPTSAQYFEASGFDHARGLPMVVLVDGGSASSAEIVAAALQDEGRAVIVGSSSYGKGTVQMVVTLQNTAELSLTWARLVTPSGTILHGHGVVPAFCTSIDLPKPATGDAATPEEVQQSRLNAVIENGLHPTPGIATRPRASLDDSSWEALRKSCPVDTRDRAIDLKVAKRLLQTPTLYAQALTLTGVAVARVPAGHALHSALQ
jgi:carboxyl-terminal processing protease